MGSATTNVVAGAALKVHAPDLPYEGGVAGYAGSESCRECHADQHESWYRTYHRTMTQIAKPASVRAPFDGVTLTNEGTRFALSRRGEEFWVGMNRVDSSGGADSAEARVGLVTGSHHMQVFWVSSGEGNAQIGFPFTWLIPEGRWVPRTSTFVRPPDMEHRAEMWNVSCSRCHSTGIEPRMNVAERTLESRAGELGISCEACHGPGQAHVTAREKARSTRGSALAREVRELKEVVHPKHLEGRAGSQVCGFCHSMKYFGEGENWRVSGFRYRPGEDLEATTPIIRPSRVTEIPALAAYLARNPEILADFFWSDGMVRVSGREYNGLIESPCYKDQRFSCMSCHSLHESAPDDMLSETGRDDAACLQCHERYRDRGFASSHTRHREGGPGSSCYNCHMPHTTYGVLKAIRSHQVSSPSVAAELSTGRPNACNLCHLDRSLSWTDEHLSTWYGKPRTVIGSGQSGGSHAVRLALEGDAGQRALVAWHLGWDAARLAAGTNWLAPLLGQMLDDSYAAVRCVAERSMRSVGGLPPDGYDYVEDPRRRSPARDRVWAAWRATMRSPAELEAALSVLAGPGAGFGQLGPVFDVRLRSRNERPVRLRE